MNQPLGYAIGNALEVKEAILTMNADGPADFSEHCLMVAAHMLVLGQVAENEDEGKELAQSALQDGRALERFKLLVTAQGGDASYIENPDRLPRADIIETVSSPQSGYIEKLNARTVGETAVILGAGRTRKGEQIDLAVGIEIRNKVGDFVESGAPLFVIHANHREQLDEAVEKMLEAYQWSDDRVEPLPHFYGVVKE
jgi:pyrimidine-nucleoside phosphorylase